MIINHIINKIENIYFNINNKVKEISTQLIASTSIIDYFLTPSYFFSLFSIYVISLASSGFNSIMLRLSIVIFNVY